MERKKVGTNVVSIISGRKKRENEASISSNLLDMIPLDDLTGCVVACHGDVFTIYFLAEHFTSIIQLTRAFFFLYPHAVVSIVYTHLLVKTTPLMLRCDELRIIISFFHKPLYTCLESGQGSSGHRAGSIHSGCGARVLPYERSAG